MCDALIGKNATITGTGIASGYVRDFSVTNTIEYIDATGIGSVNEKRDRVCTWKDNSFRATGMTAAGGVAEQPGDVVNVTSDVANFSGYLTEVSGSGSFDGLVVINTSGIGSSCAV